MSLPFFDALQECFPYSHVDIIAKETTQEVFLYHPAIRTIFPFSKSQVKGLFGLFNYGKALQKHGPYELFITLPHSFSSALIGYGVGSRIRIGYRAEGRTPLLTHGFSPKRGIHRVYAYRYLLQDLQKCLEKSKNRKRRRKTDALPALVFCSSVASSVEAMTLHFSEEERHTAFLEKQENFKYVIFNVNAEAQSRRLPLEKWVVLGNRLLKDFEPKIKIVFIGTPHERPRVAEVIQALEPKEHVIDYAGKTSIRELAMLLRDADAVVTNDSGPMHLTNAVGTPMVTFIGAADPIETEPFNKGTTIVINKHLPCSPCVKNVCKYPTVKCLAQITVDEIYQSLVDVMRKT